MMGVDMFEYIDRADENCFTCMPDIRLCFGKGAGESGFESEF